ncbi:MAG: DegT/DnrJ/EryC1/StrS family aminotransferase [Candidatus Marinimicrobia bacterium]|jgi:perosamine synthetase|nr:DegT/DnrJ/EryC1/StrS family aminotransferase [Candidatus Neomarinimicrobiota bacterium]
MKEMKFSIGFDKRDLPKLHNYWDKIIESQKWTESYFTALFEKKWNIYNNLHSVAFGSWSGGALAAMRYFQLVGQTVLCPSNTFMATPLAIVNSGAKVQFVDCNKTDLCMSYGDFKIKAEKYHPAAVWVVHIGGHIAFDIEKIAEYCKKNNIILLEDCAHAHGASWNGKRPGEWGDAGVYSFYPTKTISTGEGGMLVSIHKELIEFAKRFRNYGKPDYKVSGLNLRISEFSAAIGVVEVDRLQKIVEYKNEYAQKLDSKFKNRLILPKGMISGYYKYIVFEEIEKSTGKVYDNPCHRIMKHDVDLPNTDWVAKNHWCVPIYYNK